MEEKNQEQELDQFIKEFFDYPYNKRFETNFLFEPEIFKKMCIFLKDPENVNSMIASCRAGRSALEGVIESFLREFGSQKKIPLYDEYHESAKVNRQLVGMLISFILWEYGYLNAGQSRMSANVKAGPFKTAAWFKLIEDFQAKKIEVKSVDTDRKVRSRYEFNPTFLKEVAKRGYL